MVYAVFLGLLFHRQAASIGAYFLDLAGGQLWPSMGLVCCWHS